MLDFSTRVSPFGVTMTKVVLAVTSDSMTPLFNKGDIIIVDIKENTDEQYTIVGIKGNTIQLASPKNALSIFGTLVSSHRQH